MPFDKTEYTEELAQLEVGSDTSESRAQTALYLVAAVLVTLWATSVALYGLPGLVLPALVMVPLMMVILVRLTRG
ncbi:hypothetical protein EI983_05280 [Roseovarius faecimaris]|uniref:Uncharacterized protein n=1 Tax=Roseovarius faecimaris TaxID=2494550 RepID=A0A6I6IPI3_9RHOB|nr:hypothetical protein [Roseovarius faecimaris]QGX97723.1 hypothetical protein EI983_05280 [Roseovarius faecimaris]